MGALVQAECNALIDAVNDVAAYSAAGTGRQVRLMTANGSATAAGTAVTGGSYAAQTVTFGAASAASASNSAVLNFTGMPAATVVGVEVWSVGGTPRRIWWGALSASKTVNAGDTFQIAAAALVTSFT